MFLFFAVWAGAQAPPKQQKNNTPPPKQQIKKKHAPAPSERVFLLFGRMGVFVFVLFGRGVVVFFAVWAGGVFFFFLLFGRGLVLFLLFGRGRVLFFAVWAGCVLFFLLFGRGTGVHSLTRLPVFKRPNNKRDRTAKKKHGFQRAKEEAYKELGS